MGPETWKSEVPGERTEDERRQREAAAAREASDPREEEGWSQPESSAQKGPTSTREPEED
jgi:hypothetical protein